MKRVNCFVVGAGILVVAGVAWYFASPAFTLSRMKVAAESKNADAMAGYIDFPALRDDLKADLLADMMVEGQKDKGPFSGLAMAIGPAMVNSMVDGFVTPAGMKAMLTSRGQTASVKKPAAVAGAFQLDEKPVIKRRGLSEFVVTSKDEPDSGMVFKRSGLGWKLSGVDLPPTKSGKTSETPQ